MNGVLADPVTAKELRGVSRQWHTYVGRVVFVAVTGYLLYSYWKEVWGGRRGIAAAVSVSQVAELGREIFLRCEGVSLVLTVLAAVLAASDMIAREVRSGSLGLLLLTSLTPWRVVLGKWKGAMMIALALYLCSVPVQAIAVYLGGVGPADLARSALFTLGTAAVGAATSLQYSARLKSGGAAVGAAVPLTLLWGALLLAADLIGDACTQSAFGAGAIVHRGGVTSTALAAAFCLLNLHKAVGYVRERTGVIPGPAELARERRTLALDERREQRQSQPRRILMNWRSVWEDNPLLWKEFTLRPALRLREEWRTTGYVILFAAFLSSWVGTRGGADFFATWGGFFTVAALIGGSLLFAPEKEGRQWLLLLSTPVTPAQIVRAKLLGGLLFPEVAGMILLYLLSLLVWLGFRTVEILFAGAFAATVFILFAYSLAAAASLRARTARSAFLFAAGVIAFLGTVPPLLSAAARPMGGSGWQEVWNWIDALNPAGLIAAFEPAWNRHGDLPPSAIERLFRFLAIYLPVTLFLPVDMVWRFRRIAFRA